MNVSRRGFNLIEAAIVLGVIGLVIGGIWVAAASVADNQRVSATSAGLLSTCQSIQRVFPKATARASGPPANITVAAIEAGLVPRDWVSGTTVRAPVGAVMTITEITSSSDYYIHIPDEGGVKSIYLENVPQHYCRRLISTFNQARGLAFWITLYTDAEGLYQWEAPWHGMGTMLTTANCGTGPVDMEIGCAPG